MIESAVYIGRWGFLGFFTTLIALEYLTVLKQRCASVQDAFHKSFTGENQKLDLMLSARAIAY